MDNFSALAPIARELYFELKSFYFLLLPLFFLVSLILTCFQGSGDFLEKVKRVFIATLLLIGFPEITQSILEITNGLADKIDDMSGIENIMKMAGEKIESYQKPSFKSLLMFADLLVAVLTYLSYVILYCGSFVMLAIYHFSWSFLTILSPVILLFGMFSPQMTVNLFKSMVEIASWKIVWAVLSLILKSLPWGKTLELEGNYLRLIVVNFVIALCIVGTPLVVRSLLGSGFTAFASTHTPIVAMTMVSTQAKALKVMRAGKNRFMPKLKLDVEKLRHSASLFFNNYLFRKSFRFVRYY